MNSDSAKLLSQIASGYSIRHDLVQKMAPGDKQFHMVSWDASKKFNNMKTSHSVWNYDMAKRCPVHITPKPIDLLKNIIAHTTDEGDMVLDCFAGSGSIGVACKEMGRNCILIEREEKYCDYINSQLCS